LKQREQFINIDSGDAYVRANRYLLPCSVGICVLCVGYFYGLSSGVFAGARFSAIFRFLLISYDQPCAWLSLGICLVAASWKNATPIFHLVDFLARHPIRTATAGVLLLSICVTLIYHRDPLSMDEYAAVFQSKVFASWHITARFPPELVNWLIAPAFNGRFLVASPANRPSHRGLLARVFHFAGTISDAASPLALQSAAGWLIPLSDLPSHA
jgi:hypothetical protein